MRKGKLIVFSAPSGGGKSTIISELRKKDQSLVYSVSATTRQSRPGENHGTDYYFLSDEEFSEQIENKEFLEWAEVHKERYGTLRKPVEKQISEGRVVLLDIDVQGGLTVKESLPESVLIFIFPPSLEVLEERLRNRGTESEEKLKIRLENAKEEMEIGKNYDYLVINQNIQETVAEVQAIIKKEVC